MEKWFEFYNLKMNKYVITPENCKFRQLHL